MQKTKIFSVFDYFIIGLVYALIIVGILFIYSSSIDSNGICTNRQHIKQIIWAAVGFVLMIFFALYDYRKFESSALTLYIIGAIVLVLTKLFGADIKGANSWIGIGKFGVQPSELTKILFILYLAKYLSSSEEENQFLRFAKATLIMLVPMGLILIQPDLGTASVFIPIFLLMCFFAGIPLRYILFVLSMGILAILFTVLPIWNSVIRPTPLKIIGILTNKKLLYILIASLLFIVLIGIVLRKYFHFPKYIYWIVYVFLIFALALICSVVFSKILKPHQLQRLIIFMNPEIDSKGAGWNIIQSKIAIGSGGALGQSYLHGTQSHLRYLPEQSTDFIFSILSEEWGFTGCFLVFCGYVLLMIRIILIIRKCPTKFGIYIATGILAFISFHFFLNVGMAMGIMPVTGVPLLFLSYGGSSLLTSLIAMGLLQSINYRKNEFI